MSCQSDFKAQEAQLATGGVDTTMHCSASPTATESLWQGNEDQWPPFLG